MWMRTRVREKGGLRSCPGSRLLGRTHLASCLARLATRTRASVTARLIPRPKSTFPNRVVNRMSSSPSPVHILIPLNVLGTDTICSCSRLRIPNFVASDAASQVPYLINPFLSLPRSNTIEKMWLPI